jgi:xanthine/CO dehydrogenase XdhC/CoxF family maturation factor
MPEMEAILNLAALASVRAEDVCLVSVVGVEGSSYRKPGARMLLTRGGLRAGTISGGCLEAEVSKKAWWLTENGASLQRYSSFFDEDTGVAYGLGCGGTVILLLERGPAVQGVLAALRLTMEQRRPVVIITDRTESSPGTRLVMNEAGEVLYAAPGCSESQLGQLEQLARETISGGTRTASMVTDGSSADSPEILLFCERIAPPPALWIFGAGDDVQPLVEFAYDLGWYITVADGRSHLARQERFPHAHRVLVVGPGDLESFAEEIGPTDAVVLMTHSYEQDRALLADLLPRPLGYLGILGPRSRTLHILKQLTQPGTGRLSLTLDEAVARLYSPVGLDISAHTPAAIALSIAAEVQASLAAPAERGHRQPRRSSLTSPTHA